MTMEQRTEILLVGETAQSCLQLMQWLKSRRCRCHFASSCKDACRLISDMRFDFVLSHFELPDRSAFPLLQKLIGSTTSLFFSTRIENGCLWLPTLAKRSRFPETRALHANQFPVVMRFTLQNATSGNN